MNSQIILTIDYSQKEKSNSAALSNEFFGSDPIVGVVCDHYLFLSMSWFFGSGSGERSEEKQNESFSRERERLQALNIETEARIWKREDFEKFRKRCSSEGAAWKQEFVDEQRKLTVWTAPVLPPEL